MNTNQSEQYVGKPMSEIPLDVIGNATIVVRRKKEDYRDTFTRKARDMPKSAIYMGVAIGGTAQGKHNEALLSLVCHLP